jgi:dTDP-4-dehydrorhamnose 3,5-epimerase-like enzyme
LIPLKSIGDERGQLVAIEEMQDVPFDIARAYYVYGVEPEARRGLHAHRTLMQFAVAVSGSCSLLLDDGKERATISLESPSMGLLLPPMVWHEMADFSADCVLLVLAAAAYDEADYIRDYGEFSALVGGSGQ